MARRERRPGRSASPTCSSVSASPTTSASRAPLPAAAPHRVGASSRRARFGAPDAVMLVHSFSPTARWFDDLRRLRRRSSARPSARARPCGRRARAPRATVTPAPRLGQRHAASARPGTPRSAGASTARSRCPRAARRAAPQGHRHPLRRAPAGRRVARARGRRQRGRGDRGPAARRRRGPGRRADARGRSSSSSAREVAHIVAACSDTDVTPKPPWRERKEAYIAHLRDPGTRRCAARVARRQAPQRARDPLRPRAGADVCGASTLDARRPALVLRRARDGVRQLTDSPMAAELRRVVDELDAIADAS